MSHVYGESFHHDIKKLTQFKNSFSHYYNNHNLTYCSPKQNRPCGYYMAGTKYRFCLISKFQGLYFMLICDISFSQTMKPFFRLANFTFILSDLQKQFSRSVAICCDFLAKYPRRDYLSLICNKYSRLTPFKHVKRQTSKLYTQQVINVLERLPDLKRLILCPRLSMNS